MNSDIINEGPCFDFNNYNYNNSNYVHKLSIINYYYCTLFQMMLRFQYLEKKFLIFLLD